MFSFVITSLRNFHGIFIGCNNMREVVYDGTYEEFKKTFDATSNPHSWFGTIAGLASTNCILKCKDQTINLRIDV